MTDNDPKTLQDFTRLYDQKNAAAIAARTVLLVERVEKLEERLKAAEFIEQARQPSAVNVDPVTMVVTKESMPDLYARIERLEQRLDAALRVDTQLRKEQDQMNERVDDLQSELANLQSQLLP